MQRSCDHANAKGVRLNRADNRYTKIGVPRQDEQRYIKPLPPTTDFLISPQASHLLPCPLNQAKDQGIYITV